jgi:hypothetical protein
LLWKIHLKEVLKILVVHIVVLKNNDFIEEFLVLKVLFKVSDVHFGGLQIRVVRRSEAGIMAYTRDQREATANITASEAYQI